MPREFVFMDRAAIGLGAVFLHLAAELNFYRLFNEAIEAFSVEDVAARQAAALAKVGSEQPIPLVMPGCMPGSSVCDLGQQALRGNARHAVCPLPFGAIALTPVRLPF